MSFLCIWTDEFTKSQLSFLSFRLWVLNYQAGAFGFITTMSAFTLNTLKQRLPPEKRLAVCFPAVFSCKILGQLGRGRVACEGRACNWSRLPQMKHGCLKRQWHTFSLTCSVRSSLLAWSLTVSHEPICTGLTKVALSAGRRSNRSFVCGEQQRRISTDIPSANTHLHAAVCWKHVHVFT